MGNTRSAGQGFRFKVIQQTNSENTFAVTLAVNKNEKQNKAKYYEQT
jgi:hypothetical protein